MTRRSADLLLIAGGLITLVLLAAAVLTHVFKNDASSLSSTGTLDTIVDSGSSKNARRTDRRSPKRRDDTRNAGLMEKPRTVEPPSKTTIIGVVIGHDDLPLEGVQVTTQLYFPQGEINYGALSKHTSETQTDADGRFTMGVPGYGAYKLTTWHALHAPEERKDIRAGEDLEIRLTKGGAIHGKVTSSANKKGVFGALVEARDKTSGFKRTTTTDEQGGYAIMGLYPREITLTVVASALLSAKEDPILLNKEAPVVVNLEMSVGKVITGTVYDPKKTPLSGAVVIAGDNRAVTDETGEFRLSGFKTAQHQLKVNAEGFLTAWHSVNMSGSRQEAKVKITVEKGAVIEGVVVDENGEPLPLVSVQAFESWGSGSMWSMEETRFQTLTDTDGRFSISGLSSNSWSGFRVQATLEGYAPSLSKQIKPKSSKVSAPITLQLSRGGTIKGRVFDDTERPLAGAKVVLIRKGIWGSGQGTNQKQVCITDASGRFAFGSLATATYSLHAVAPGFAKTASAENPKIDGSEVLLNTDIELTRGFTVTGKVSTVNGDPIPGASVTIKARRSRGQGETDDAGIYVVRGVAEGPYTAEASCKGFVKVKEKDVYASGGTIDLEMKRDGFIRGRVVDAANDEPIKDFGIELKKVSSNNRSRGRRTVLKRFKSEDGSFKVHAGDGDYMVTATTRTHTQLTKHRVTIVAGVETPELLIRLDSGGALEGWVVDHRGRPISGAEVFLRSSFSSDGSFKSRGRTENDGYFYSPSIKEGSYDLAFQTWDQFPLVIQSGISINPGQLTDVRLSAMHPSDVTVEFVPEEGVQPKWLNPTITYLGDTPTQLSRSRSRYFPKQTRSVWFGSSRTLNLRWMRSGSYELVLRKGKYEEQRISFYVDGASPLLIEVPIMARKRTTTGQR